jgi:multicomponent K+:H+ antiporter subunit G
MSAPTPAWVDVLTAALVMIGGLAALMGSFGLLRLRSFFQRVHAPTLATTLATWSITLATLAQASFVTGHPYIHALLVVGFVAFTSPVTTVIMMRAAVFRGRLRGDPAVPMPADTAPGQQEPPLQERSPR